MKYANFVIKTALGDIFEFDRSPVVKRDTIKIGNFLLRLNEVRNVIVVHSTSTIVIDLVDGPPSFQNEDRASALSKMSKLEW